MTIYEAAIQAMQEVGKPLSIREVYELILERGLYDFKAQYPLNVVQGIIRRHTENINASWSSPDRYFLRVEGGKFVALDFPIRVENAKGNLEASNVNGEDDAEEPQMDSSSLQRQIDAYNKRVRGDLLEFLKNLTWEDFEHFAAKLLSVYGFEDVMVTPPRGDRGIDGHGKLRVGLVWMNVAFQCKRWTGSSIGVGDVNQFRGAIQGAFEQGVFFATSTFTQGAKDVSIRSGAVPVVLIDGERIVDLMVEKGLGVQKDQITVYSSTPDLIFQDIDYE